MFLFKGNPYIINKNEILFHKNSRRRVEKMPISDIINNISAYAMTNIAMNIIAMFLVVVILVVRRRVFGADPIENSLFSTLLVFLFFSSTGEVFDHLLIGNPGEAVHIALSAVSAVIYISNVMFAFVWAVYVDFKLHQKWEWTSLRKKLLIIPVVIALIAYVVNIFVPIVYVITPDNVRVHLPLIFITYIALYGYPIYAFIDYLIYRVKEKRYYFFPMESFLIPAAIGIVFEAVTGVFYTTWIGVVIAINAVFLSLQSEKTFIDGLTGLYNREYFNSMLSKLGKGRDDYSAGIMLDLNDFKEINDTLGHHTGDQALSDVGSILIETLPKKTFAARYGGDEFMILIHHDHDDQLEQIALVIDDAFKTFNETEDRPYVIQYSIGMARFSPDQFADPESFIKELDEKMYQSKEAYHRQKGSCRTVLNMAKR